MRWDSRLGLRLRAAARRLSATAFLEKFRHGPDTQSEWNLFLWRVSFPMIPLVLFTTLAVLGQCGHLVYSLLVCPVWYFSHLVLVAHPFLIVFRFENVDASSSSSSSSTSSSTSELESANDSDRRATPSTSKSDPHGRRVWQALALLSLLLSVLEWVLSTPPSAAATSPSQWAQRQHNAWISANSLFGLAALVAVPHFFFRQKRRAARDATCQPQRGASGALYLLPPVSPSTPTSSALSAAEDGKPNDPFASSGDETDDAPASPSTLLLEAELPPTTTTATSAVSTAWRSPVALWRWLVAERVRLVQSPTRRLLLLCALCASALWTAMVASYTSTRALEANLAYWFAVYLLSPLACGLLWVALRQTEAETSAGTARPRASTFSFEHVVTYSVLVVHLPACLGHLCFRLFTLVELSDPAHGSDAAVGPGFHASAGSGLASAAAASTTTALSLSATTSWMKLATSMLFLLVMQGYFHVMTRVVNAMSEPYAHPSLLYLGQLYYYLFWYVLVGSDTPIDMLYWGQLLINYVHIALLNTGIYSDVKASSTSCCASVPSPLWGLLSESNSSVLMCFRAAMIKSSADHEHASGEEEDGEEDDDLERAAHELLLRSSNNSINDDNDEASGVQHRPSQRRSASVAVPTTDADAFLLGTDDEDDDDKNLKQKKKKRRNQQRRARDERRHRSLSMIAASARSLLPFSGASAAAAAAASSSAATIYFAPAAACVSNCASGGAATNSACSLCRTASTGAPCTAVDHHAHHRLRHHSSDSTDSATPPASQSSGSYRAKSHRTSSRLHQHKAAPSEHMRQLYFLMKLAEQDNMADTTALILVPSLLTLLAVLDKPTQGLAILLDQTNLWLRCICMFIGRLGGAYLAREIFTYKLRRRLRQQQADRRGAFSEELLHNIGGLSTRLWIQKLMLQDFHRQFWYLTMVTVVVTFACFERMELPARFAFLN
ncbi:hypothetical protein PINS_up006347 [Pythium insidiosum]|nr:hypothetical protein PINS_up006347 [Pythium insidiosum]